MRIKRVKAPDQTPDQGAKPTETFQVGFVGTAWCVVDDRYLVTAHHVLNEGQERQTEDRFYAFTVPGNGSTAFAFPVVGFPLEAQASDMAVIELGPPPQPGPSIPSVAVTFDRPPDGEAVLTVGFPAPKVVGANLAPDGTWQGGKFFLMGHANEGIVAAQYELDGAWAYEFNVGWHHGESGGPVFLQDPLAAVAVMQFYRNIETPHGRVAGPHVGRSLDVIRDTLVDIGARVI